MTNISGSYYFKNGSFHPSSDFPGESIEQGEIVYEVLRITSGVAVFMEDHISRFHGSLALAGTHYSTDKTEIKKILHELMIINNAIDGNVKIILHTAMDLSKTLYAFFIPHFYPDDTMYRDGVYADLFKAERKDPNIKKIHPDMIQRISAFIAERKIYDALLVDEKDCITEGSKTNVFFVKNNDLYTASSERVLKGITRQKIVQLCHELELSLCEQNIPIPFLHECDAAFFTGTSPKVLPIGHIANFTFHVTNPTMRLLMKAYDDMMETYISSNREY